jgi:branched-subunit amino acid ABC-type transport system permease component
MKRIALRMVAVIVALSVCLAPAAWAAEQNSNPNPAADLGLGVASFVCSVPYGAVKVAVAILGGVIGGFTYVLSGFNKQAADAVWYTTIEGDYIVTPDHLRGKKDLRFTGVPPERTRDGR